MRALDIFIVFYKISIDSKYSITSTLFFIAFEFHFVLVLGTGDAHPPIKAHRPQRYLLLQECDSFWRCRNRTNPRKATISQPCSPIARGGFEPPLMTHEATVLDQTILPCCFWLIPFCRFIDEVQPQIILTIFLLASRMLPILNNPPMSFIIAKRNKSSFSILDWSYQKKFIL